MLKRRLRLQIYATIIASLITVVVLTALLWNLFNIDNRDRDVFQIAGRLVALTLAPANAPVDRQRAAIERLGSELNVNITLFDRNRKLVAANGPPSLPPAPSVERSRSYRVHGDPFWALRLDDGRWLVASLAGRSNHRPLLNLALLLGSVALGVGLVSYPFVRRLTGRLERLQAGVQRIGSGDLTARVDVEGRDEIAQLATSFNEAAGKIEKLVGAHRLLLANASHELRTPLSRIRLGIEFLQHKPGPDRTAALQQDIAELDELIDEILLMSRLDARSSADLSQEIDLVALVAEECARYAGCTLTGTSPAIPGDVRLLHRLVRNLLDNAVKYGAPPVTADLSHTQTEAILTISDTGQGIPEGLRDKVFQPFYRAPDKQNIKGYGLGLALVRQIAEAHGGSAIIVPADEAKSAIRVTLPI
ncbi:MAG: HAMP domain-containing histidine kinase [Rhizobiales bacterium]|nr:HAMP domain-containing histidine kinase [Hyphomicrobiales bacterium]